ncbi:MAG: hypothetical protein LBD82_08120 [Deltaproteobacteria bacterium]|nr:hypothetical protein [Deltaproteobacteria bacterium]
MVWAARLDESVRRDLLSARADIPGAFAENVLNRLKAGEEVPAEELAAYLPRNWAEAELLERRGPEAVLGAIGAVVEKTLQGDRSARVSWKFSRSPEAETLSNKTGLNIQPGVVHSISSSSIQHALNHHGNPAAEAARGQIALENSDFLLIPEIVKPENSPEYIGKNALGLDVIRYKKSFDGVTVYVLEEVRVKTREFAFQTMWKKKAAPFSLTSETLRGRTPTSFTERPADSATSPAQVKPEKTWSGKERAGGAGTDKAGSGANEPWAESGKGRTLYHEENMARGLEAMNRVIAERADALNAMYRPDVGGISFYWGTPGTEAKGYHDGGGVAHIIAARNFEGQDGETVARELVNVLADGKAEEPYGPANGLRRNITHNGHTAVLSLYRSGDKQTWLLTGWKDEVPNAQEGIYNPQGYTPQPSGSREEAVGTSSEKDINPFCSNDKLLFADSVNNRSTFDPHDPRILYHEGEEARAARARAIMEMPAQEVKPGEPLNKEGAESLARSFGKMENKSDGRIAELPVNTIGKILRHKGFDVSTILADIPGLYENALYGWPEELSHAKGKPEHSSIEGFRHYVNKFSDSSGEYFIRFAVQEKKGRQGKTGDSQIHSTIISEISVYRKNKGDAREQVGIINPLSPDASPFVDKKLQNFFNSVKSDLAINSRHRGEYGRGR